MTGHTLGAAGALGAVFGLLALEHGVLPGTVNTATVEPGIEAYLRVQPVATPVRHMVSNAFAFGGSNCVLVLGQGVGGQRS
jgi:3-oxoacyl-[acyl-carrier-protein] synthase-1